MMTQTVVSVTVTVYPELTGSLLGKLFERKDVWMVMQEDTCQNVLGSTPIADIGLFVKSLLNWRQIYEFCKRKLRNVFIVADVVSWREFRKCEQ